MLINISIASMSTSVTTSEIRKSITIPHQFRSDMRQQEIAFRWRTPAHSDAKRIVFDAIPGPAQPVDVRFHRQALGSDWPPGEASALSCATQPSCIDRAARVVASVVRLAVCGSLVKMRAAGPCIRLASDLVAGSSFRCLNDLLQDGLPRAKNRARRHPLMQLLCRRTKTNLPPRSACIRFA